MYVAMREPTLHGFLIKSTCVQAPVIISQTPAAYGNTTFPDVYKGFSQPEMVSRYENIFFLKQQKAYR